MPPAVPAGALGTWLHPGASVAVTHCARAAHPVLLIRHTRPLIAGLVLGLAGLTASLETNCTPPTHTHPVCEPKMSPAAAAKLLSAQLLRAGSLCPASHHLTQGLALVWWVKGAKPRGSVRARSSRKFWSEVSGLH
jgi:hypothetical protein